MRVYYFPGSTDGPYWLLSACCYESSQPVGFYYLCWSASDDNYLLFSIRIDPADQWGFIIFLHYCRINWWSLLIIICPLLWIQPTCRVLLSLLIDIASASDDNYLLFSIRIDPANQWWFIIFLQYCRISWWSLLIIICPLLWIQLTCRVLLILWIDIALARDDNYLLFSIRIDLANQWGFILL